MKCECPLAGWCERRQHKMTKREHEYCQGTSGLTREYELFLLENLENKNPPKFIGKKRIEKPEPTVVEQIGTFSKAVTNFVRAGLPVVSDKQYEDRLKICETCSDLNKLENGDWHCRQCGCKLNNHSLLRPAKAKWATEECPLGKWKGEQLDSLVGRPQGCCGS
jgi:hypothetical protein